jgi:GNAT superfamily N-acetyltransferase
LAPDSPSSKERRSAPLVAAKELDKPLEKVRHLGNPAGSSRCQHGISLLGFEVAGVLVDLYPSSQTIQIKLRVELSGVNPSADTKSLHRATLRVSKRHRMCRQLADRLLVADVRAEGGASAPEQGIFLAGSGDLDPDTANRLGIGSVDNCTLVPAERSDSVTRAQEREIALDNLIQQRSQFGFHPPLCRRLDVIWIAGLERSSAKNDSRPLIKINSAELGLLHPDSSQLSFVEASAAQHRGVLVVGGNILGPNPEHQERLHVRTLRDWCQTAGMFEVRPLTNRTWADLEELFELPGGSIVRGCWCIYYRKVGPVSIGKTRGPVNKEELHRLVRSGVVPGLVGYANGSPVGWISLGPRGDYRKLERSRVMKAVDETPVWSIVCTYVAKAHRGNGYQHKLLAGAIDYARDQGVRMLEAYPVDKLERSHDDFMFFGSRSLYERAGFREVVRRSPTRIVMRRRLRTRRTG